MLKTLLFGFVLIGALLAAIRDSAADDEVDTSEAIWEPYDTGGGTKFRENIAYAAYTGTGSPDLGLAVCKVAAGKITTHDDGNCTVAAHRTRTNQLKFPHWHITDFIGSLFTDKNGNEIAITTTHIKNFYDFWYGYYRGMTSNKNTAGQKTGYTNEDSEDVTFNCWSYAFGYGTGVWINDPRPIYTDDYVELSPPFPRMPGVVLSPFTPAVDRIGDGEPGKDTHVKKLVTRCSDETGPTGLKVTKEKFRCSRTYVFTYVDCNGPVWDVWAKPADIPAP